MDHPSLIAARSQRCETCQRIPVHQYGLGDLPPRCAICRAVHGLKRGEAAVPQAQEETTGCLNKFISTMQDRGGVFFTKRVSTGLPSNLGFQIIHNSDPGATNGWL